MGCLIFLIPIIGGIVYFIWEYEHNEGVRKKISESRSELIDREVAKIEVTDEDIIIAGLNNTFKLIFDEKSNIIHYLQVEDLNSNNNVCETIIKYGDIMNVELLKDSEVHYSKSILGTVAGTIVGGAVAGGAGATVGGLSGDRIKNEKIKRIDVKIKVRNLKNPSIVLTCFNSSEEYGLSKVGVGHISTEEGYNIAVHICEVIGVILDKMSAKYTSNTIDSEKTSITDELDKLFSMKEKGLISDEEFLTLKQKLIR